MGISRRMEGKRAIAFGLSVTVGMLVAGVVGAFGSSATTLDGGCRDLAKAIAKGPDVEYNIVYLPETNSISFNGAGRTYTFDPRDSGCRSASNAVRSMIVGTEQTWSHTLDGTCASMKSHVASGKTVQDGRHVNLNAGRKFISEWCK